MARQGLHLDPLEATLRSQRSGELADTQDTRTPRRLKRSVLVLGMLLVVGFVLYTVVVGLLGRSDSPPSRAVDPFLTPNAPNGPTPPSPVR
jgi:hypothetical protein